MKRFLGLIAAATALMATSASAASLIIDDNGTLVGAAGVEVLGVSYDVEFIDGTFDEIFNGGAALNDLPFTPLGATGSVAALTALGEAVLTGTPFDNAPDQINGCSLFQCSLILPLSRGPTGVGIYSLINGRGTGDRTIQFGTRPFNFSTTSGPGAAFETFARFSVSQAPPPIGAIPEPSTWAMLLLGFFGIGGALPHARRGERMTLTYS